MTNAFILSWCEKVFQAIYDGIKIEQKIIFRYLLIKVRELKKVKSFAFPNRFRHHYKQYIIQ